MIPCVCPSFFIQKFKHLVFISPDYLLMYEIYLFLQYVEVYTFKIRNSLSKFVTNKHIDIQNNGYHQQRNAYLIVWNLLKKFVDMWQPGSLIFQKPTITIKDSLYSGVIKNFILVFKFLRFGPFIRNLSAEQLGINLIAYLLKFLNISHLQPHFYGCFHRAWNCRTWSKFGCRRHLHMTWRTIHRSQHICRHNLKNLKNFI